MCGSNSGSTHAFVLRDRADGSEDGLADLYLEGTDQHRGWFHSSMLQACGTRGRAPYRGVLTHGFTLDEKGNKMSKSLGNTVAPEQVVKQYGADILRLWVAQSDYTADLRIGPEILKGTADGYRRLRNTMRFLLGSLADFTESDRVEPAEMPELERWVLHRLAELDTRVRDGYAAYDFQGVFQAVFNFATVELSAFYFDIRKDALYCDGDTARRRAARTVLDILFHRLTTWLAPVLVFTMEEVWLERFPGEDSSVHLQDIPETPAAWLDEELAAKWARVRAARRVVTAALEVQRTDKVIGASLEAAPMVHVRDTALLEILGSVAFEDVCITSAIGLSSDRGPGRCVPPGRCRPVCRWSSARRMATNADAAGRSCPTWAAMRITGSARAATRRCPDRRRACGTGAHGYLKQEETGAERRLRPFSRRAGPGQPGLRSGMICCAMPANSR